MYTQIFGDLKVMASAPIPTDERWFTLACSNSSVNLHFGESKTLRINSPGQWTHSVFFWRGGEDKEFDLFLNSLPEGHIVYKNPEITVIYLRNNVSYGCLRMSMRVHKSGKIEINNRISDKELKLLDDLYELYQHKQNLNSCLNLWINNPLNIDLSGEGHEAIVGRNRINQLFLEPLQNNPVGESDRIETLFKRSLTVNRIDSLRQIVASMFVYANNLVNQ